jgi:Spx/MgsR family transcriptional regulator
MTTLYGIPNCDTIRKARRWLDQHDADYRFHDFRKDGLQPERLRGWVEAMGWEMLLNRRGMTWRRLSDEERSDLDSAKAVELMLRQPALIKRPVLEMEHGLRLGFREQDYQDLLEHRKITVKG